MAATQIFHTAGRRATNQFINGVIASRWSAFWVGLRQLDGVSGHPSDAAAADTMSSNLQEVSGGGYARVSITLNSTNVVESLSGADSILTFAQQTFTFSGVISGITHAFYCTGANATDTTGVLFESAPLSTTRNVASGDQLKVTYQSNLTQG